MPLDPCFAALLADRRIHLRPPTPPVTLQDLRNGANQFMSSAVGPELPRVAPVTYAARDGRSIAGRAYFPSIAEARPALLFLHGGAFIFGNLDSHDAMCRMLAASSGCTVLAVDYRLSPEHPYPAGFEDAVDALRHVARAPGDFGVRAGPMAVAGDSAGGNIALGALLSVSAASMKVEIAYAALIYPVVDPGCDTPSMQEFARGYMLTREAMQWAWASYARPPVDVTPADLARLPPMTIITAELDPLRDEGEALAAQLREAGVPVRLQRCQGMIHGFAGMPQLTPMAGSVLRQIGREIRRALTLPSITARQQALEAVHAPWQSRTLDQQLAHTAQRYPDRAFVITDERAWTYAEMDAWVDRLACGLVAAGVQPGEHVAVVLANYPEFVAIKFAIARVGATMVPVNYLNRRDELGYVLRQSDAVALVTMDRFRDLDYLGALDELMPGWEQQGGGTAFPKLRRVFVFPTTPDGVRDGATSFARLERAPGSTALPAAAANPEALSDIIYTSGTTGAPKGVMLSHDMMLRAAYGSAYGRAFEDGHRILFSLPMYHVFGYVEGLLSAMFAGGAIVPRIRFDAADTLEAAEKHGATDLLLIPTMTLALIDEQKRQQRALPALHATLSSGGRAPAYLWDDLREWLGTAEITTGYGMTECTASTTVTRPDDPTSRLLESNGRLRDAGAAGIAAKGGRAVEYRVLDPATGLDVPPGEMGELVAKGLGVTQGYYKNPQATAAAFTADGWLHTGDLGCIDADGYLRLTGRLKESYRCGGETVMPTDAEDCLVMHPTVLHAYVVPVPDPRMGEVGAAFVVARSGATIDAEALLAYCRENLARFKVPKYLLPVTATEVPVTPSGRARKFMLTKIAIERLGLE